MYRLFYHQQYPGVWMVRLSEAAVVALTEKADLAILQGAKETVGYNLFQMPKLSSGYHKVDQEKLAMINERLRLNNIDELIAGENPLSTGLILTRQAIDDSTWVCEVDLGEEIRQIVTKAVNAKPGVKVVVALPGAVLYNGTIIEEGKVYGQRSQGVFGSEHSLFGSGEKTGLIIELPDDTKIGEKYIYGKQFVGNNKRNNFRN